jgi:hypothetical protein
MKPQIKHKSDEELVEQVFLAHEIILNTEEELKKRGHNESNLFANYYYHPSIKLSGLIDELKQYISIKNPSKIEQQSAGKLMEKIAFVSLRSLKGINEVKSFQSVSAQYDLLISGDELTWSRIFSILGVTDIPKGILIEAKAYAKPIEDKHFSRLCNLIQLDLDKSVGIGIFFTIKGATGFPQRDGKRKRCISDCRFRQVLFHAKTNKSIIVLDSEDIFTLDRNGSLILLLKRKIGDIEKLTGLPTELEKLIDVDLPPHLSDLE